MIKKFTYEVEIYSSVGMINYKIASFYFTDGTVKFNCNLFSDSKDIYRVSLVSYFINSIEFSDDNIVIYPNQFTYLITSYTSFTYVL